MFTVRKFNEFDSVVPLTYFCTKIDNWQNANLLTTNFASFEPVGITKTIFSNSEGKGGSKNRFFPATSVTVLQICL
jgi:hypothetical protein